MRKYFFPLATFFFVAACALAPKDVGRAHMFALDPLGLPSSTALASAPALAVALPLSAPDLDTYRIALIHPDGRHDYYAGARWVEFLPLIVQDSLIKTFERAGAFRSVTALQPGIGAGDELTLKVEIRAFQAEYKKPGAAPVVRVNLAATVLSAGRAPVSFAVSGESPASRDSLPAIQAAFSSAFIAAQKKIALRVLKKDQ